MSKATRLCIRCEQPGKFETQTMNGRTYTRRTCMTCRGGYKRDWRAENLEERRLKEASKMRRHRKSDYYKSHPEKQQFTKAWSRLNLAKYLFITIMRRRQVKDRERFRLEMTFEEFLDEIGAIPDTCPVLGIPLFIDEKSHSGNLPSVDRIDSSKPYQRGNIAIISRRANILKNDGTAEEHRRIAEWITSKSGG